ncbi:IS110 family transposase [Rhodococcus sp. ARC_M6]|uniref:IS110 family transposase n=1 Tax=Rhodococcus sp. ARC_M6 TaxID=2928852 RepID=UPI001FB33484|nr:IS110 family transposase [Rhodococcus sp. ARC_M6]MCJ0904776.1 IS110 family transposase [Rhodococcus sp. ARC_M6]
MRDRTRTINRLRALLSTYFPSLERSLDISNVKAALILLSGYQTPDGIRRLWHACPETWLRKRKAYNANQIAVKAIDAAQSQHTRVAGQDVAARTTAKFAVQVMNIEAYAGGSCSRTAQVERAVGDAS